MPALPCLGFVAGRWGSADLHDLEQWALGGRSFGTIVSWFLLGGDLYTAYTFIAVPALVYGIGALGFFAVPYATIAYPIALIVLSRFWSVARARGYVTSADFVRDRYGNRALEIAVALTGVVAAMPYIALQLVGMRTVFGQFSTLGIANALPALTIAFILLAAYTYTSGLRAPALIAFVKDTLIYATVIAAIVVIPARLGGWAHVFATSATALAARPEAGLDLPRARAVLHLCDDGARFGTLALHLPALDHERLGGAQPTGDPAQCRAAADLLALAGAAGAAGLLRGRRGHFREGREQRRSVALRALLSRTGSPAWPMPRS